MLEHNQDYKSKPLADWSMWDQSCYELDQLCEEHDKAMGYMSYEYQLIQKHYGDRVAERSGVPLMNHIDEGLAILTEMKATEAVKAAFCLHPLLQSDEAYKENLSWICEDHRVGNIPLLLAVEYRTKANSYLCKPSTDYWHMDAIKKKVGVLTLELRQMLIADKRQNYKDFMTYHSETHARSWQLLRYFTNWFRLLGDYSMIQRPLEYHCSE